MSCFFWQEWECQVKILAYLEETRKPARFGTWTAHDVEVLNRLQLLTAKQIVYLVNLSKRDYLRKANKWLPKIQVKVEELGGGQMIPFSVEFEQEVGGNMGGWAGGLVGGWVGRGVGGSTVVVAV